MRLWIAEINQDAVAHVAGDKPAKALSNLCDAAMVGADDPPQILGIEPRRQRRRADQITEHHSELPAFGAGCRGDMGVYGALCRDLNSPLARVQARLEGQLWHREVFGDAYRKYPNRCQVFRGQAWQHFGVDVVIAERWRVLFKP